MEIDEKDKETLNDNHHHHNHQPYCFNQQQINEEDEIRQEEKHSVDKMILLQQALSQASVTRAKRCKQVLLFKYKSSTSFDLLVFSFFI